jgi:hypothetical protein
MRGINTQSCNAQGPTMHPIIKSKERAIESMDEADRFERFVNYCIVSNRCPTRFDPEDITTDEPEVGIDGVALLVDYPGLAGFVARFKALPGIAARLASRQ